MNGITQRIVLLPSSTGLVAAGPLPMGDRPGPDDELRRVAWLSGPFGEGPRPRSGLSGGPEEAGRSGSCHHSGRRPRRRASGGPRSSAHAVSPRSGRRRDGRDDEPPGLPPTDTSGAERRGRGRPRLIAARTVRAIVLLVSGGESLQGVANLLNDAGVPTPSETKVAAEARTGRWSKFMVRNVLTTQHGRRLAAALLRLRAASAQASPQAPAQAGPEASPLPDAQESDRIGQEGVGER